MTRRKIININNQIQTSIIGFENNFAEIDQYQSFVTPKMFLDAKDPFDDIKSGLTYIIDKNISGFTWYDIQSNSQPIILVVTRL